MSIAVPAFGVPSPAAVANRIVSLRLPHPVRVAVDGRTASGKTTFAAALARAICEAGRPVISTSVDAFHNPAAVRHQQGRWSPDGYYDDARDLHAIRTLLLDPLGPNGDRRYVTQSFDLARDERVVRDVQRASANAVLIVDGTFLQRPELSSAWDFVVFLEVPEAEARRRGGARDGKTVGEALALELYTRRYGPAFTRYELECQPTVGADTIIRNSN